jgi:UDP-3-O-[3-hydroxymyristoyl] glucosamine N-acyltransferase
MSKPEFTLAELAGLLNATYEGDPGLRLTGISTLDDAGPADVSFLANPKYREALSHTKAGAVIVAPADRPEGKACIVTPQPYLAFARAVRFFHPPSHPGEGISPGAHVAPSAQIASGVVVMAGAYVEADSVVGEGTVLYPGAYVGRGVKIGRDCVLYSNVTVREECILGDRVILQPGCVVGSDGFGYASGPSGHEKIPQVGIVRIADDVEIGSCSVIDRAALGETRIGRGTKIDNLVQIAHNVVVGEHCFLAAQAGIAGSAQVGNRVILAGQVGVAGHLKIGDGVTIGAQSGVPSDVPPGVVLSGSPVMPHKEWIKSQMVIRRLPQMRHELQRLERRLEKMEQDLASGREAAEEKR